MRDKINNGKMVIVAIGTWISNMLGLLYPIVILLAILMMVDYVSGILAARKEALDNPESQGCGLNSKKGIVGIYKKFGYMVTIFVAICIDFLVYKFSKELGISIESNTLFGVLVTIWFVINELISILENVKRLGVSLPQFLDRILAEVKKGIDEKK